MGAPPELKIRTLTRDRCDDLASLFATSPVTRSCWCMWPRVPVGQMHARTAEQNQRDFRAMVDRGEAHGLLAYLNEEAVGWCSVGPRREYGRFPVDTEAQLTWLVGCLFMHGEHRRRGIGKALLDGAAAYADEHGAVALEGPPRGWRPDDEPSSMEGTIQMFRDAGFRDVPAAQAHSIMRKGMRKGLLPPEGQKTQG